VSDTETPAEVLANCTNELRESLCPAPDDILEELSPRTQLFFVRQLASELLVSFASRVDPDDPDAEALEGTVGKALAAIGEATGNLTAACIAMGVFPEDAT
jgi:hypothetical protein